jgi:hypothetical protein
MISGSMPGCPKIAAIEITLPQPDSNHDLGSKEIQTAFNDRFYS